MLINGIHISSNPFGKLKFVGTLCSNEFPMTTLYLTASNEIIILEWADLLEGEVDLSYMYKISEYDFKLYFNQKISHLELIKSALNKVVVFVANHIDSSSSFSITGIDSIPIEFLPDGDVYFDKEDCPSFESISNFLEKLGPLVLIEKKFDAKEAAEINSKKSGTDIINLHIRTGKFVKFGKMDTDALGNILTTFHELYSDVVIDSFQGAERSIKLKKLQKKELDLLKRTEVVNVQAASFSLYIKPSLNTIDLDFENESNTNAYITSSETIYNRIQTLLSESISQETISKVSNQFSHQTFNSLNSFAERIKKFELTIDLNFFSSINNSFKQSVVKESTAQSIVNSIDNYVNQDEDNYNVKGQFIALNCKTYHFTFSTVDDKEISGYFDAIIKDSIHTLNFIDLYEIGISDKMSKKLYQADFKVDSKIVSCLPVK